MQGRRRRIHGDVRRAGFLRELAQPRARARNLVVLYLSGGNDSLSMLVPYNDRTTTAAGRSSRFPPVRCCRSAPTVAVSRSGCTRG